MKKRILSIVLTLALCLGFVPVLGLPARAAEEWFQYTAPDGVIYNYGRNVLNKVTTVCLVASGIEAGSTNITIPEVLEGTYTNEAGDEVPFSMEVAGIKKSAFYNCDSLETATIQGCPILDGGFYQCDSLRELDLSECTATTIDDFNFAYDCPSLETVTLPAGLTRLSSTAFGQCRNLRDVYFLGSTAPAVTSSTLHSSFNNAAIFHVPSGASGYDYTGTGSYRHVVDYGNKDNVPYGMDFEMEVDVEGQDTTVKGNRVDLGSGIQKDFVDRQKKAIVTITNTGSDGLRLSVRNSNVNVFAYSSSRTESATLFPGEKVTVEITIHDGSNYEAGTHTGTVELTLKGQVTEETVTEAIELTYTVDGGNGLEVSPTEIDFGDIPADTAFEDMPTATVTVTNNRTQKGYLHLYSTDMNDYNRVYVQYVKGDGKTPISGGESITFTIQLTPWGLLNLQNGKETYAFTLYERPWSAAGNVQISNGSVTLKANPVHSSGLSLSSSSLDLGKTESAYYSANRYLNTSVKLTNTGTQDVVLKPSSLSNFAVAGAFSLAGSYTLKAGESVPVTVMPKDGLKPGVYEETVTISGGENKVTLRLKFTVGGGKETMEVSSSYLDFGRLTEGYEQPAAQTVTVKNTGAETITLLQPAAADFEISRISSRTLEAGETATFTVRPKAGLKAENGKSKEYRESFTISTEKGLTQELSAVFTVDPEGSIIAAPSKVSFGGFLLGYEQPSAQTVTIKNPGVTEITLKQPVLTGSSFTVGRLSATTLKAGQSATFTVQPKAGLSVGNYTDTITVATGGKASLEIPVTFEVYLFDENDKPSDWAQDEVAAAIAADLVPQSQRSKYTEDITRVEFCALATQIYETVKGEEIAGRSTFVDTDDVNVQKMAFLKVVDGRGENKFDPHSRITRQEAATILARLANAMGYPLPESTTSFNDQSFVADWAEKAVGQVAGAKIMNGTEENVFSPGMNYTRQQSILTILRLYRYVTEQA